MIEKANRAVPKHKSRSTGMKETLHHVDHYQREHIYYYYDCQGLHHKVGPTMLQFMWLRARICMRGTHQVMTEIAYKLNKKWLTRTPVASWHPPASYNALLQ